MEDRTTLFETENSTMIVLALAGDAMDSAALTGLLFGMLILGAVGAGWLTNIVRVPRVVGYLLAGALIKTLIHAFTEGSSHAQQIHDAEIPLHAIKDLALGLILFTIGGVFEVRHLRSAGKMILKLSVLESGLTLFLVSTLTFAAGMVFRPEFNGVAIETSTILAFSLLLGTAAIATAPAATLFVLREYDAKGPVTDTILSLTGFNNITCLILFQICFVAIVWLGLIPQDQLSNFGNSGVALQLIIATVGSLLIGTTLGMLISAIHAKLRITETLIVLFGLVLVLVAGEEYLAQTRGMTYSYLLTMLCAGAVFSNVAIDPDRLSNEIKTIGQPFFLGFFVIAGYQLHLTDLPAIGAVGIFYILTRTAAKVFAVWFGIRKLSRSPNLTPYLGLSLLCQAAVVIGLADFVSSTWTHPWAGQRFQSIVLGSVVIFEMIGPLLVKWSVVHAGEVKAVTLIRRGTSSSDSSPSTLRLTLDSFMRTLGLKKFASGKAQGSDELAVSDVMRSNIRCLSASAKFDEVLHFVEGSRHNDFPVIDDQGNFVGVIHFHDIRQILYDPDLCLLITAADLIANDTKPVTQDLPLKDLLEIFRKGHATALPVVQNADSPLVIGVIEQRDVLRALHYSTQS